MNIGFKNSNKGVNEYRLKKIGKRNRICSNNLPNFIKTK